MVFSDESKIYIDSDDYKEKIIWWLQSEHYFQFH